MAKNYNELREKIPPERRRRNEAKARQIIQEMLLAEIRKLTGKTQQEVADALGIRQPSLSQLEHQDDMQVGTLARLIHILGGELELIAKLPTGSIRITQFDDAVAPDQRKKVQS